MAWPLSFLSIWGKRRARPARWLRSWSRPSDGVFAVPGRGPVSRFAPPHGSLRRARPASSCTRCQIFLGPGRLKRAVGARVIPSTKSGFFCAPHAAGSSHVNKNASVRPSWQMRRTSVSKSPTTWPSKCARSSIKPHPPKADAWPLVSLSAYQPVTSPKSPDWAGPYASGRMPSWPTSIQPEPATHPTEAINGHYRAGQTNRQRLPQPHQLPTPNAPHRRRPRRLHPHPTLKSRFALAIFSMLQLPGCPNR